MTGVAQNQSLRVW